MKARYLFLAVVALFATPAAAADLATKAPVYSPVANPCTPTSCSGFYAGAVVGGVGTSLDIIGSGVNGSVFGGGGVFMADAGYQYAMGNIFAAVEVGAGGQISTNATVAGLSGNENGFMAYEIVKLGGNLNALLNSPPITVPTSLTQYLISPYGLVGAVERPFANGWATGAGATFDISPKLFLDLKYMYINYGASSNGAANFNSENLVLVGLNYKFNY